MFPTCPHCQTQQIGFAERCQNCGQPMTQGNPFATPVDINPYASPSSPSSPFATPTSKVPLAGRGERFAAVLLDGVFNLIAAIPGAVLFVIDASRKGPDDPPGTLGIVGILVMTACVLGLCIYQWIQISNTGQSLGKKIMGIRIAMLSTGRPPGFVQGVIIRSWVPRIIGAIPCGIGVIFSLVDICFIFSDNRRCLHDQWAGTHVVQGKLS